MDMETQATCFQFSFSRMKGSQLFLFLPDFPMSNESLLNYLGYEKDLWHLKQYVLWIILCRII